MDTQNLMDKSWSEKIWSIVEQDEHFFLKSSILLSIGARKEKKKKKIDLETFDCSMRIVKEHL